MGTINSGEGMMIVGAQLEGPYICQDDRQSVVMKFGSNYEGGGEYGPHVIHTGAYGRVFNDIFPQGEEKYENIEFPFQATLDARIVTTGKDAEVYDNGQQTIIASLAKCRLEYGYWTSQFNGRPIDDESKVMSGNIAFLAGENSNVWAGEEYDFINSTIISTGNYTGIDIHSHFNSNNVDLKRNKVLTVGQNSNIRIADESVAVSLGKDSYATVGHDSVAVSLGKDSYATVGRDSVILSSENSTSFSLGKGGCAAIVWHDGDRKRVKVVYEGEDGIQAGQSYKVESNGVIT